MGKIENWELWREKMRTGQVERAWTHSILRNLYRGAEDEFHVVVFDNREWAEEEPWEVHISAPVIDRPGSFISEDFRTKEDALERARSWMRSHPLESELGWMGIVGNDDREFLEEERKRYERDGIDTRIVEMGNGMMSLEVDTEDFIEAGYSLL